MFSGINSYNTYSNAVYLHWLGITIVLSLFFRHVDDTLFEVTEKYAIQLCQVATVVMETTQLVLSQFKNFLS